MSIHLTPESQTPNISPDSIKIIKETNLFTAPAVLYGKTNMLVNWGGTIDGILPMRNLLDYHFFPDEWKDCIIPVMEC